MRDKWKIYIFVRMKDQAGIPLKWSKGKIGGQIGHAMFRMSLNIVEQVNYEDFIINAIIEYFMDGEIKIVYKVDDFPEYIEGICSVEDWNESDEFYKLNSCSYVQFVTDLTTGNLQ